MLLNHHRLTLDIHTGHAVQLDTLYMHYMLPCKLYTQHTLQIHWTRCTYTECTLHTLHTNAHCTYCTHDAHFVHCTHTTYNVHTHYTYCTHSAHSTHAELLWGTLNSSLSLCSNWVHCGLHNAFVLGLNLYTQHTLPTHFTYSTHSAHNQC